MNIDWANKPDWADAWIEDEDKDYDQSGWHRDEGKRWFDNNGFFWDKNAEGIKIHYPPKQPELTYNRAESMSKPDWNKAPEGATHWTPENNIWVASWWKLDDKKGWLQKDTRISCDWSSGHGWTPFDSDHSGLETRPVEWNGPKDGLPPIGTICEVETSFHKVTAEIKLYDGDSVVYRPTIGSLYAERISDCEFRPLKTEEEKAVDDIARIIYECMQNCDGDWKAYTDYAAKEIRRNGYRKQEKTND